MNKIGFFEQFYIGLMKHKEYKQLTSLPLWKHIIYIMGVTFLLFLISYVIPIASFIASLGGFETFFKERIPAFAIENGQLTIEENLDFTLNGVHYVVSDEIETYVLEDIQAEEGIAMLFSQNNLVTNMLGLPVELVYDELGMERIDNQVMADQAFGYYLGIAVAGAFSWGMEIFGYLFMATIFSLFAMSTNKLTGTNLPYSKVFVIALYAETVYAIVQAISVYLVSGLWIFLVGLVVIGITMHALNVGILCHNSRGPGRPDMFE